MLQVGGGLTVRVSVCPSAADEMDLLLIQARKGPQLLVFARIGKRIDSLVAVVEVRQEDVGTYVYPVSSSSESTSSMSGGDKRERLLSHSPK